MSILLFSGMRKVPSGLEDTVLEERNRYNSRQLKTGFTLAAVIAAVLLCQHLVFPGVDRDGLWFSRYTAAYGGILVSGALYLVYHILLRKKLSQSSRRAVQGLFIALMVLFLTGLTWMDLHFSQELAGFIIVLLYISAVLWLEPKSYVLLATLALAIVLIGSLFVARPVPIQFHEYLQPVIYYALGWLVYLSVSSLLHENFLNRISLEDQYKQLETETVTDPLTGLYNRRALKEDLLKEMARSERSGDPFCIMLVDIDHFKDINDSFGHSEGDSVIREMAELMRNTVRLSDRVYRYGGEEFLVILPEIVGSAALQAGERLRIDVEKKRFSGLTRPVTVSIGVAQNDPEMGMDVLINRADRHMYRAKENGRNCVVFE